MWAGGLFTGAAHSQSIGHARDEFEPQRKLRSSFLESQLSERSICFFRHLPVVVIRALRFPLCARFSASIRSGPTLCQAYAMPAPCREASLAHPARPETPSWLKVP